MPTTQPGVSLVVGFIKWQYYTAAELNRVTVTPSTTGKQWALSAFIVSSNDFNLAQRPLILVGKYKNKAGEWGAWHWPIQRLEVRKDTHQVTATLGPPLPS